MDVSSYRKLRIPLEWVKKGNFGIGFEIELCENNKGT